MEEQEIIVTAPEMTEGFPGTAALTRDERMELRAALTEDDVEKALSWLLAARCGLTMYETLYCGEWPADQLNAASVKVTGELTDVSPDFRSFAVRLTGREAERGTIVPALSRVLGSLPGYWLTLTGGDLSASVTVAALTPTAAKIETAAASGRRIRTLTAELRARICTAPPRSC